MENGEPNTFMTGAKTVKLDKEIILYLALKFRGAPRHPVNEQVRRGHQGKVVLEETLREKVISILPLVFCRRKVNIECKGRAPVHR